jgi:hypothetical protein
MKKKTAAKKPAAKAKAKKAPAKRAKKSAPSRGLTAARFKKIALGFPGAHEKLSYGSPSICVVERFFTRLRSEDDLIVLRVGSNDERDMLLEADPVTFTITDHYRPGGYILARLDKLDPATLKAMLERRWRAMVPKKMQTQLELKK